MNNVFKTAFRLSVINGLRTTFRNSIGKREFARNLWYMSKIPETAIAPGFSVHKPSLGCNCGCGAKFTHSKSERELVEFLTEEIVAERKGQKVKTIPSEIDGFKIKLVGAEVELAKQNDKEKVVINFNVNHSVDTETEPELDPNAEKPDFAEMKSKPQFEVDIVKGTSTLSFTCSFLQDPPQQGEYNDIFGIDELTIYEGTWNDKIYAVAGDVLDGYLYDLLMNLLEEKGVSNEFVEKLAELSTAYEHSSYITLLENVSKFTSGK